eukprot:4330031-Alexandrium_andersonii.AAC.1
MASWVSRWQLDEHLAGVRGKGAQDGWFSLAAETELAQAHNRPYILTSLDLYKAFDQINRG